MTQDLPNTVGDQSAFWQRQRELTQGRIEDPAIPPKPASPYYGYLIYTALIAGVVGCGVMFLR
jgi:hypothetical protein